MHAPKSSSLTSDLPDIAADILARLRATNPRVHCITNAVAQNFTANVLLATGALPSMTVDPAEIAEFVDRAEPRTAFAKTLVDRQPWAIRLNGAEFSALAEAAPEDAALKQYVLQHLGVIALTGATDIVTDGARFVKILNGDPLMTQVTAMGCAGAAVVTACLAVEADPWLATAAGLLAFALAGECAAMRARGPGSLAVEIIDALAGLDRETMRAR